MQNLSDIRSLSCLEVSGIKQCGKMTCLPTGSSNLPNLKTLEICELSPDVSIFPFPNLNDLSPPSASLQELHINPAPLHYTLRRAALPIVEHLPSQLTRLQKSCPFEEGQSVQTTIGSNVSISMQTLTDGKFLVPILCIITLSSQDGAIELATDTQSAVLLLRDPENYQRFSDVQKHNVTKYPLSHFKVNPMYIDGTYATAGMSLSQGSKGFPME
ncbi:hypothetical protein Cgig2_017845 [Carnegiea gigantea]|uniref:Uncharacterized protein n=1 Tax=Carnegiea gigantea TaxID=171969 RepID=A0A9Q1QRG8_9CARY|nr:hypothetical protein Cgig2_017845 [Carnegiea gigantea]